MANTDIFADDNLFFNDAQIISINGKDLVSLTKMHEANGTIYRFGTQNSTTAIITASTNNINNRTCCIDAYLWNLIKVHGIRAAG